ncbi:MAG: hypothetical protein EB168_10635, partial [Euryarchaeota archaeon]|nr:hypothetical protein [Euryarchaeota archaeon]
DDDGYAGWVIVSGTGVWGQSGVWVIKNPNTGQTQEVDWDNGTYSNPWENNPNNNETETGGANQGEGQGSDPDASNAPPAEEPAQVAYPDNGSACYLDDGSIGVKKDGQCIAVNDPSNGILVWPDIWSSVDDSADTPPANTDPDSAPSDPPPDNVDVDVDVTSAPDADGGDTSPGVLVVDGVTWGTGSSDDGNTGTGNGTGNGNGNGNGNGDGDGNGDGNGDGDSSPSPNQFIDGSGGGSKATWSPLPRGYKFVPRRKGGGGMLSGIQSPNFATTDYTQQRMGLLSQAMKDLA